MRVRDAICIMICAVIFRAFLEIVLASFYHFEAYYISLLCQSVMYVIIFAACKRTLSKRVNSSIVSSEKINISAGLFVAMTIIWPLVLLAFSLGENAVEVIIYSHINVRKAYTFFHFHVTPVHSAHITSLRVLSFIIVTVFLAPFVEELIFRRVILREMMIRGSIVWAVTASSLMFTAFHFSHYEYVSIFIFSIFVCAVYIRYKSLMLVFFVHAGFNFMAFVHQYYLDIQWTRSLGNISHISDWIPQIFMLVVSSPILLFFIFRTFSKYDDKTFAEVALTG